MRHRLFLLLILVIFTSLSFSVAFATKVCPNPKCPNYNKEFPDKFVWCYICKTRLVKKEIKKVKKLVKIDVPKKEFSPTSPDESKQILWMYFNIDSQIEVKKWQVLIEDESERVVRKIEGWGKPPHRVAWDGKDDDGVLMHDGKYYYEFIVVDESDKTYKDKGFLASMVTGGPPETAIIRSKEESEEVIWSDDFESYSVGSWPSSNWVEDANGGSVTNSVQYSGSKSLKITGEIGGCWAGFGYRRINTTPPFYIEVMVRNGNESTSGCHPDRAGIELRKGTSWRNPARNFIQFCRDGNIRTPKGTVLCAYQTLTWYKVKIKYEVSGSNVIISYWINDEYKGTEVYPADPNEESFTNLDLNCQEGSCWFDDVRITKPQMPRMPRER